MKSKIPNEIYSMIQKYIEKRPNQNDSNFNYVHQENVFLIVEKAIDLATITQQPLSGSANATPKCPADTSDNGKRWFQ